MVRITAVLARNPVIKFRKGGLGNAGAGSAHPVASSALGSCPASAAPRAAAASAPMSTSTLSDVDLPARYRRQPLSEEEIAHINGGGIA